MARKRRKKSKTEQIAALKLKNSQLEEEITTLKTQIETIKSEHKIREEGLKKQISQKDSQIANFKDKTKGLLDRLDKRELKRLAIAYSDQETDYKRDGLIWLVIVAFAFALTFYGAVKLVELSQSVKFWYENINHLIIAGVLITFLVFSLKQYSYYIKLRTDYANRKTLAQSYHNILSSIQTEGEGPEGEEKTLKLEFIKRATDVLCARADVKSESYTLPEKILEKLTEIVKGLSKIIKRE